MINQIKNDDTLRNNDSAFLTGMIKRLSPPKEFVLKDMTILAVDRIMIRNKFNLGITHRL